MGKVMIMNHPLIQHKIGIIRRKETGTRDFRALVGEIAMLECYESMRDLELQDVEIDTPITHMTAKELKGKKWPLSRFSAPASAWWTEFSL